MGRTVWAALLWAVALCCIAPACSSAGSPAVKPLRWILNGPALSAFTTDPGAVRYFAGSKPFVMQRRGDPVRVPASWDALPVRSFTSYGAMQRAFAARAIEKSVRAVLYDSEAWQFTPLDEQRNPGEYVRRAAQLAHAHGLLLIATPATNLVRASAQALPAGEKRYDSFIRLGIARDAARYADAIDIQAQGSERDTAKFAAFVKAAAAQARGANPKVLVFAGISTNPSGVRVSADDVLRAIDATEAAVDGYWLNVPQPGAYCPNCTEYRPDIALEVLQRLANRSASSGAERPATP